MGCACGGDSSQVIVHYSTGSEVSRAQQPVDNITGYVQLQRQIRWKIPETNYQNFFFRLKDKNKNVGSENSLYEVMQWAKKGEQGLKANQTLNLELIWWNVELDFEKYPALKAMYTRVVKFINQDQKLERIGYLLAPNLVITSIHGINSRPKSRIIAYLDSNRKLHNVELDYNLCYIQFDQLKLAIIATKTQIDNVGFDLLKQRDVPKQIAVICANQEFPHIRLCEPEAVDNHSDDIIYYHSNLTTSACGSVIVDSNTWEVVGVHHHAVKDGEKGSGALFNGVLRWIANNKSPQLEKFGIFYERNASDSIWQKIEKTKDKVVEKVKPIFYEAPEEVKKERPSPPPEVVVHTQKKEEVTVTVITHPPPEEKIQVRAIAPTAAVIQAIGKAITGMVFARSAMLLLPTGHLSMFDFQSNSFNNEVVGVELRPGAAISSTIPLVIITGVTANGEKLNLAINKKGEKKHLPTPFKPTCFHSAVMFQNHLYAISGFNTRRVEHFNFQASKWDLHSMLPKRLSHTTGVVSGGHIFVAGGQKVKNGMKPSHAIYKFDQDWSKINARLHESLSNPVLIPLGPTKILILGGFERDEYNKKAVTVDLVSGESDTVVDDFGEEIQIPPFPRQVSKIANKFHLFLEQNVLLTVDPNDWQFTRTSFQLSVNS